VPIAFSEAIPLAALGLGVNLISAWLLREDHDHDIALAHDRGDHGHADHNPRAPTFTSSRTPSITCLGHPRAGFIVPFAPSYRRRRHTVLNITVTPAK